MPLGLLNLAIGFRKSQGLLNCHLFHGHHPINLLLGLSPFNPSLIPSQDSLQIDSQGFCQKASALFHDSLRGNLLERSQTLATRT